jgi:hypothetical protein
MTTEELITKRSELMDKIQGLYGDRQRLHHSMIAGGEVVTAEKVMANAKAIAETEHQLDNINAELLSAG